MKSIEEYLQEYARSNSIRPDESKMQETLQNAKQNFYESAAQKEVSYLEFIYEQTHYIRKRWWILQFFILFYTGWLLQGIKGPVKGQRPLGVLASLFVILLVPELWKNRNSNSLEIEGAACFSLRQIYAARLLVFIVVDSILLGVFAGVVTMTTSVSIFEMIFQFFLPMAVTCCICFRSLCSRYAASEYAACLLSMLWSYIWMLLIANEHVYLVISGPALIGICGGVVLYLTYLVKKVINECICELLS